MTPYYDVEGITIYHADCLELMASLDPNSIDAIITDPPYGLTQNKKGGSGQASENLKSPAGRSRATTGFMGMTWDHGVPGKQFWEEALRVAKPGAHLLAFGGTRTFHRLICAIEDAGWEIRDTIMWVYASGFPKSHNLKDEWDGWGTALKPAWEPIIVARKPLVGTVAQNVLKYGTGAMNIDGCRVETDEQLQGSTVRDDMRGGAFGSGSKPNPGDIPDYQQNPHGRWPANLIHDGSDEVLEAFPDAPGQLADASTNSDERKTQNVYGDMRRGRGDEPSADSENAGDVGFKMRPGMRRLDSGSAARFFYCAKASREDRNAGCDDMERKPLNWSNGELNPGSFQGSGTDKTSQNHHPTVKPTELMRYLCRLVTPPAGVIFDPFMGSGSTGKAAMREDFRFMGCDREETYCQIAVARIRGEILPLWRN